MDFPEMGLRKRIIQEKCNTKEKLLQVLPFC
jgi:hypothetical protein